MGPRDVEGSLVGPVKRKMKSEIAAALRNNVKPTNLKWLVVAASGKYLRNDGNYQRRAFEDGNYLRNEERYDLQMH
ncbi:hypothetical protein RHMOL_Rhmol04G0190700 [Rhododendron molle]|uniref:Uncharacterized protein n=1 Tax=Rhododendron molle TaxID=49168 RepID=A0ACC0P284_RHOML|nr:hypothetical protein RHMOL_Rhmol04G0190700 [Rhododendron molle]